MSITLYTPATGFPDLEAKLAYGLARVGIEAFGIDKIGIQGQGGFYAVTVNIDNEFNKLDKSFNMLCKRLLSSSYIPFSTPGIKGRSAESIPTTEDEAFSLVGYKSIPFNAENKRSENVCRHKSRSVGNIIGFATSTSYHHRRDGLDVLAHVPRRPTNPKKLCKTCALLSLLGTWYASFIFNIADKEVMVIPIPNIEITGSRLQEIFALQHQIRKNWLNQKIPQVLIPMIFLSKIPSSADILNGFDLFVAILSGGGQRGYHVDGLFLIPIEHYLDFIQRTPYNIATIDAMLRREAHGSLLELNKTIYNRDKTSLLKFSRLYVQETSTNNFTNLLYPETARYLLKEVYMINSAIIENPALGSLARTLRYFIREKKYGYADDIRNARKETKDFEDTIAKMLREGELRRVQQEQDRKQGRKINNWIHLPKEDEIKEVFRLANDDFDQTKTALVILAFSFPSRADDEAVETVEGVPNEEETN